jgi:hypothetical protein
MKRNLINEITAVKARSIYDSRYDITRRLIDIKDSFVESLNNNKFYDTELLKYIPIATVACFEAFFRSVTEELIDFGKPYSENVINFNQSKNIKFDFDIINAIQTKKVTIGEFISHVLSFNNFDDINSNLSILIGIDFLDSIKTFKKVSIFDFDNDTSKTFIKNSDQIIKDIKRTFELRHIFCHEFATNIKIDRNEILQCLKNSEIFLNQADYFIWGLINPNAPKTQAEMNFQASEKLKKVEIELSELISLIKKSIDVNQGESFDPALFAKTNKAWEKYRKVKAEVDASYYIDGSIYPLMYTNSLIATTKEKIESLKNEFSFDLKKIKMLTRTD